MVALIRHILTTVTIVSSHPIQGIVMDVVTTKVRSTATVVSGHHVWRTVNDVAIALTPDIV